MLGAASQEYSVAYFGFDSCKIMEQFISKYNNFVVEVDQKRKYCLEVSRAWYQPMPMFSENNADKDCSPKKPINSESDTKVSAFFELEDFKLF